MLYDGKDYYFSKRYNMQIVDCVGGGDGSATAFKDKPIIWQ